MSAASAKLPPIALAFWITKIAATTLGETAGDQLSMTMHLGYAASSLVLLTAFAISLAGQLAVSRYVPALYWLVILTTSTAGTTLSDLLDRSAGLGYATGSALLVSLLALTLATWRLTMGSLAVAAVRTRPAELLYWSAILISNTLGTALGDFLADSSGLGFAGGALLLAGLLASIVLVARLTAASRVALFWLAFVLTRPLGATVGDVLSKPVGAGGVGLGTLGASLILLAILVGAVARETWRRPRA